MPLFNFGKKKKKKETKHSYANFPGLELIKAHESYVYHSDYFEMDGSYACIMMFRHSKGATDNYPIFWGVNMIPNQLPKGVTTINLEQVERMGEGWIDSHQASAEKVGDKNAMAQAENGSLTNQVKAKRTNRDLLEIANELTNGASYLHVNFRLLVKAPTLKTLDEAVDRIEREYTDRFSTLNAAIYNGRQKQELASFLGANKAKYGKGFYFTSTQYAGQYDLVTHGLEDPAGEYVGVMQGDVNQSAVLFDVDRFKHHIVVASNQFNNRLNQIPGVDRVHVSDLWGAKLSQAALLRNHRVIHIVLDSESKLSRLGPQFEDITYSLDMSRGDINMFEMFGDHKDELSIFPQQMQKLTLMLEQISQPNPEEKAIIENTLHSVLTNFYVQQRMWYPDAQHNRDKLSIVGIPHREVPRLRLFVQYLTMAFKRSLANGGNDTEEVHATKVLKGLYDDLLSSDGDLFDTITSDKIDGVIAGRRVVYNFGDLLGRGKGIAMAQLVNVIGYAVSNLGAGDLIIFHGSENIDPGVRDYLNQILGQLYARGGRVAFLYNQTDKFLADQEFNKFDQADYTIVGELSPNDMTAYEQQLGSKIPADLKKLITTKDSGLNYIRRGTSNIVFTYQLPLCPSPEDYGQRKRKHYN